MATALALIEDAKTWLLLSLIGIITFFSIRLINQNDKLIEAVNRLEVSHTSSVKDIDHMKETVNDLKNSYSEINNRIQVIQHQNRLSINQN
jgi:predicted  nucleic acid-binding Zn-ribbon protein